MLNQSLRVAKNDKFYAQLTEVEARVKHNMGCSCS